MLFDAALKATASSLGTAKPAPSFALSIQMRCPSPGGMKRAGEAKRLTPIEDFVDCARSALAVVFALFGAIPEEGLVAAAVAMDDVGAHCGAWWRVEEVPLWRVEVGREVESRGCI